MWRIALKHRLAVRGDIPALSGLMEMAIVELQKGFPSGSQIAASRAMTGLDTQLIDDGTYFVIEQDQVVAGCGGCSRRATLYGGDRSPGRDAALLNQAKDAARVRAMYTHPALARQGVGRLILVPLRERCGGGGVPPRLAHGHHGRRAAVLACGYVEVERIVDDRGGAPVPLLRMAKGP